jgi:hypothetical protein
MTKTKTADRINGERLARAENACGSQGWHVSRQGSPAERFNSIREQIGGNLLVAVSTLDEAEAALAGSGVNLDEHSTPKQMAVLVKQREAQAAAQEQQQAEAEAQAEADAAAAEAEREAAAHVQAQATLAAQAEREVEQLEQAAAQAAEEAKVLADRLKDARATLKAEKRRSA